MVKSYSVLFENDNFLIVNKVSGIAVHRNLHDTGRTLIGDIVSDRGENYFLVNRIDKYTSGLVLVAKNRESLYLLQELFLGRKVEKYYLAILERTLPAKAVKITLSLGRSRNNKLRFTNRNAKNYKSAYTEAEEINGQLIRIFIKTGRTHQIRAHLFSIGCPIMNDPIYGGNCQDEDFGQYLHSHQLRFTDPFTDRMVDVSAPPPPQFGDRLRELNIEFKG